MKKKHIDYIILIEGKLRLTERKITEQYDCGWTYENEIKKKKESTV